MSSPCITPELIRFWICTRIKASDPSLQTLVVASSGEQGCQSPEWPGKPFQLGCHLIVMRGRIYMELVRHLAQQEL